MVPIKAIVLNLLSVAASYGVMVLVFQHGWGKSLLGFTETGPIESWIPLFMLVVLFGLSMDYHVFILSRVREAYDNGMKTEDAVGYATKNTAGVVTSAAVVMVAVFASMKLLRDRNWWLPRSLGWIPESSTKASHGRSPPPEPERSSRRPPTRRRGNRRLAHPSPVALALANRADP